MTLVSLILWILGIVIFASLVVLLILIFISWIKNVREIRTTNTDKIPFIGRKQILSEYKLRGWSMGGWDMLRGRWDPHARYVMTTNFCIFQGIKYIPSLWAWAWYYLWFRFVCNNTGIW